MVLLREDEQKAFHADSKADAGDIWPSKFLHEAIVSATGGHGILCPQTLCHYLKGCPRIIVQPPYHPGVYFIGDLEDREMASYRCEMFGAFWAEMVTEAGGLGDDLLATLDLAVENPQWIPLHPPAAILAELTEMIVEEDL
jgi:hypothetical protein